MSRPRDAGSPIASAAVHDEHGSRRPLDDIRDIGAELIAAVRDNATAFFEQKRNRAADEIAAASEVLQRSVQSLDHARGGIVARCSDEAAQQIGDFAAWLRSRSWGELTGDIEDVARRYPAMFIGTATAIGFVAGRFLTASATRPATRTSPVWPIGEGGEAHGDVRDDDRTVGNGVAGNPAAGYGTGAGRDFR